MQSARFKGWTFAVALVGVWVHAQDNRPILTAELQGNELRLFWPIDTAGYELQEADQVNGLWQTVDLQPEALGAVFQVAIPCAHSARFFRLRRSYEGPWPLPAYLGLVLDPAERPVINARVGPAEFTDENGVFSGNLTPTAAGWFRVDGPGYVSAFVHPVSTPQPTAVVQVWLTPYRVQEWIGASGVAQLAVTETTDTGISVSVSSDDLEHLPAYAALAELDPLRVDPLFNSLEPAVDNVYLHRAFSIQAFNRLGDEIQLAQGRTLTLTVHDDTGLFQAPELARFDPESGKWLRLSNACQRLDEKSYLCSITQLWPLYGLFVAGNPPYGMPVSISATQNKRITSIPVKSYDEGEFGKAYDALLGKLRHRLLQLEKSQMQGGQEDPSTDPAVRDLLEQMARLASDYANANRNEAAKFFLLMVAQRAGLCCQLDLQNSLVNQATDLANEIAERLLDEGDCGRLRQMMRAIEQLILLAGDPALEQALYEKIQRLLNECDLWTGWVRYFYRIDPWLSWEPDYQYHSGATHWTEKHDLRMATHAQTQVLTGEIVSTVSFPTVRYRQDNENCGDFHDYYGYPTENESVLYFGGRYDGHEFALEDVYLGENPAPVKLTMFHISRSQNGDGNCVEDAHTSLEHPVPFYSAIMHGFQGPWEPPPISLQEMTESDIHNGSGEGETIRGAEHIVNPNAAPWYPFTAGEVYWSFIRVRAILPLER
ncbi:MAG: hypothetical protein M1608_04955 [Candidatus Omnitrophica bacterium]|nr:hypothetical protein [Candidatus Omnitrophota bacterium]